MKKLKKLLAGIMTLAMLVTMLPATALAEGEQTPKSIDLISASATIKEEGTYDVVAYNGSNALTIKLDDGEKATVTLNGVNITADEGESAISIESGNVTLNVAADSTLTGGKGGAGIYVAKGASVTIKGGTLTAIGNGGVDTADSGAAGIGGTYANGNSGAITIDGAKVVAKGYGVHGSGIGSGSGKVVGEIKIINGADVTAYGGHYADGDGTKLQSSYGKNDPEGGAAIGGGGKTVSTIANITISDSKVTAYGGSKAAGIGANFWCSCGTITISGNSNVTAQGGSSSAGIGTSREGDNGVTANIVISGGKVTATGGAYGAGIGRGYNNDSLGEDAQTSALPKMKITISGGEVTATGGEGGAGIGGGYKGNGLAIDITGGKVTAAAGPLVSGKTVANGGGASAIGSGANGSGSFVGEAVEISENADVKVTKYYEGEGSKPAVQGHGNEDFVVPVAENKNTGVKYTSIQDAVDAADDGDIIKVINDVEDYQNDDHTNNRMVNVSGKTITIDLNGKTLKSKVNRNIQAFFCAENDGHLILEDKIGDGGIEVEMIGAYKADCLLLGYTDGKLTVNGGNYKLNQCNSALVYSQEDEIVTVNDGTFILGDIGTGANGSPWIFNAQGQNVKNIIVNGGTFNADILHQYYPFEVSAPKERALKKNSDDTWTMVDAVAYVNEQEKSGNWYTNEVGYATIAEAIAAVDGYEDKSNTDKYGVTHIAKAEYVTLLKDCTINFNIEKAVDIHVKDGCELTITGGNIKANIIKEKDDSVKISGGSFKSTDKETFYLVKSLVTGCDAKWNEETGMWDIVPAEGSVAVIGNIGYKTLADAVEAAKNGDKIVLLEGSDDRVEVSKEVTFTLVTNGNAFTGSINADKDHYCVVEGETYTVAKKTSTDLSITPSTTSMRGKGEVTLTVDKSDLPSGADVTVTCDQNVSITDNDDNTYTVYLPNRTQTYTFTVSYAGDDKHTGCEDSCTVDVTRRSSSNSNTPSTPSKPDADKPNGEQTEPGKEDAENKIDLEKAIVLTIDSREVMLFGQLILNDVAPEIQNDRTMLPIRIIAEALGCTVTWNEELQMVTIVYGDTEIIIIIGGEYAYVNGEAVKLDAPAYIANDRTYLPIRFISEILNATVLWDEVARTVTIIPE